MKFENIYKEAEENMRLALLSLWTPGNHSMRHAIEELFDKEPLLSEPVFQSTFGWELTEDDSWHSAINQDVWNKLENIRRKRQRMQGKSSDHFLLSNIKLKVGKHLLKVIVLL